MGKSYDKKMHSAEHMLNAAMDQKFGCGRCFNAHIGKKKSKCDYTYDRDLTRDEVEELNETINRMIRQDLEITDNLVSLSEARQICDMKKVPEHAEHIRIVSIGDFDLCPCIGDHVRSTKEIGSFKITTTDYDGEKLRIRYKLPE